MFSCIICESEKNQQSVEHIIPGALGNIHYVLPKGAVCRNCNTRFARWEHSVLNSKIWLLERQRLLQCSDQLVPIYDEEPHYDLKMFMLKILYEALHRSRPHLISQFDGEQLRRVILGQGQVEYIILKDKTLKRARPIPKWMNRMRLRLNHLSLNYVLTQEDVYFEMRFGRIYRVIRYSKSATS